MANSGDADFFDDPSATRAGNSSRRMSGCRRPHRGPFIQDGVTGVFVDRLPPCAECVKNVADEVALATFVEGIRRVQQTDRHSMPSLRHIAGQLIEVLETASFRREPTVA
jgi:hypothetical protein